MNQLTRSFLLGAALAGEMTIPATAQNPSFAPGDLILFFQNPGGTTGSDQTVMLNLGGASVFRDSVNNSINLANIGSLLTNTFGASWWETDTLYMGLSGVWSNSALGTGMQNGDPTRTLYVSRPRNSVGVPGSADSDAWIILGNTDMTAGANNITALQNVLELNYTTASAVSPTGQSQVDNQNPFTAPGVQGTAFGIFSGGVQDSFGAGIFGNVNGIQAEAAVDLYRILARNDIAGQVGGPVREGTFDGTFVIDQAGNVSHVVVPEPGATGLIAFGAAMIGLTRRRKQTA